MFIERDKLFSGLMILLILVVVGFLAYNLVFDIKVVKTKHDETVIQSNTEKYVLSFLPNDPIQGENTSQIAIYLFADYESDNIANVVDILNKLYQKYPQHLYLVWKDLPLPKHYFARGAALAARCALDEDKYWAYNQELLKNQDALSLKLYENIAQKLKMNTANFLSCYKSGKYLTDIEDNIREAYVLDVKDVPTIFINQNQIKGDISFEKLDQIINNLLK